MVKQLLKILLCSCSLLIPMQGIASGTGAQDDQGKFAMVETVKLTVKGHSVRIFNAQGRVMEVYSITGTKVTSVRIDTADQTVRLKLSRGCYIVKIGDVARKISIL